MKKIFLSIVLTVICNFLFSQTQEIKGIVTDEYNKFIENVNVSTIDELYKTKTNLKGEFKLLVPKKYKKIVFAKFSIKTQLFYLDSLKNDSIRIILKSDNDIDTISVSSDRLNSGGIMHIDPEVTENFTSINESVESIVASSAMGVIGSRNSLSKQYSVRGGNFDENIIYVNGIEIYRPQLVRSGQQEGLSFINPNMVSSISFSSGGFSAQYGDKMSSVLSIKYQKPKEFGAGVSGGLLGGSFYIKGTSKNKKFSHISGFRYKTDELILKASREVATFKPSFLDFQTFMSYKFNSNFDINFLANVADNKFNYIPESDVTNFGTINMAFGLYTHFDGQEVDRFTNYTGAVSANFHPDNDINFRLSVSGFQAKESETFDIIGSYSLNQLNRDIASENAGDSLLNLGIGRYMKHARNYIYINGLNISHTGFYNDLINYLTWGADFKIEQVKNRLDEWEVLDSAGFYIPYSGEEIILHKNIKTYNNTLTNRVSAFVQDKYLFTYSDVDFEVIGGVRANYNTYNEEILISPRLSAAMLLNSKHNTIFRFATGVYYQPPFYKELLTFDGQIVENSTAQRSIHFILGNDFEFDAISRHFKLTSAVYYKKLDNMIPFEVDNVKVKYYANYRSRGYAAGIDTRISGQFVQGVESWFGLSFIKTEEDIYDIGNGADDGIGYQTRPTEQFFSMNLFLQDYVPGYKNIKVHLNLTYLTGFPYGVPESGEPGLLHSPDYKRVDLGASIAFPKRKEKRFLKFIKNAWLTLEVFNLLNVENTISYNWLSVVPNLSLPFNGSFAKLAVSQKSNLRIYNAKISIKF